MADRKVSELPAADALVGTEVVPGAQAGVTKKITVADIAALATGTGDVTGPASSTDNAVPRFDGIGGTTLKNSAVTISTDGNSLTVYAQISTTLGNIVSGNAMATSNGFWNSAFTAALYPSANTWEQRVGTNAQTYCLYNTTDAGLTNYERLAFTWDSNTAKIQTEAAGTGTLRTLQIGPMYTATLKSGILVTPVTTTASPAATDSGVAYTNEGDTDGATVTLPTAAAGLRFTAIVQAAQTLTITAASGDTIRIASNVTAAAGSITSAVVGSCVSLLAINATEWVATSSVGSWSF